MIVAKIYNYSQNFVLDYEYLVMRMFSYQITKTNECQKMHSNNHEEEQIINPNNINSE